jgi:hypothetical protein
LPLFFALFSRSCPAKSAGHSVVLPVLLSSFESKTTVRLFREPPLRINQQLSVSDCAGFFEKAGGNLRACSIDRAEETRFLSA